MHLHITVESKHKTKIPDKTLPKHYISLINIYTWRFVQEIRSLRWKSIKVKCNRINICRYILYVFYWSRLNSIINTWILCAFYSTGFFGHCKITMYFLKIPDLVFKSWNQTYHIIFKRVTKIWLVSRF